MKVIDPGHQYEIFQLDNITVYDDSEIQFCKRIGENFPGNTGSPKKGTNCQDVIRCQIDRTQYLDKQIPDWRNKISILCFRIALNMFEWRAAVRHKRRFRFTWKIEKLPFDLKDGHIRF